LVKTRGKKKEETSSYQPKVHCAEGVNIRLKQEESGVAHDLSRGRQENARGNPQERKLGLIPGERLEKKNQAGGR